jgi:hypothetical protein
MCVYIYIYIYIYINLYARVYHKEILVRAYNAHKHFSWSSGHATTHVRHKCCIAYSARRFAALPLYLCCCGELRCGGRCALLSWRAVLLQVRQCVSLSYGLPQHDFPTWKLHQPGWLTDTTLGPAFWNWDYAYSMSLGTSLLTTELFALESK